MVEDAAPVVKIDSRWRRTALPFRLNAQRIAHLTRQRELEWAEMQAYLEGRQCLMQFLAAALDDPLAQPCGKCAVCRRGPVVPTQISHARLIKAQRFVRQSELLLELKKQWDVSALPTYAARFSWSKANIPLNLRGEPGRILSRWGEPLWGAMVAQGKVEGRLADDLVTASAELIQTRWKMASLPAWVTCIPSTRHPDLVPDFAMRLAAMLGLPFRPLLIKTRHTEEQKGMQNRYHQCHNLDGAFAVAESVPELAGPVLLVDDVFDSGWTLTLAVALLRQAGSGPVHPYALATTTAK